VPRPEYYYYRVTDRPYHQKGFYSRISMEDAKRKAEEWLAVRGPYPVYLEDVALQWLDDIKPDMLPSNYLNTYLNPTRHHILPHLGDRSFAGLGEQAIRDLYRKTSHLSQSSLDKIKICLVGIFDLAVRLNIVERNPATKIRPVSKKSKNDKRVLSHKQITDYHEKIKATCPEAALIIMTGMRVGEICGKRTDDAKDVDQDVVPVYRSVSLDGTIMLTKNRRARFIPCKQAADLIYQLSLNTPHGYLFGDGETPPKPGTVAARIRRKLMSIGLPNLSPHELRHTFATNCKRHGMDVDAIRQLLGHSDVKITEGYIKDEIDPLREAMKTAGLYDKA